MLFDVFSVSLQLLHILDPGGREEGLQLGGVGLLRLPPLGGPALQPPAHQAVVHPVHRRADKAGTAEHSEGGRRASQLVLKQSVIELEAAANGPQASGT